MAKIIRWNDAKNEQLKIERNISFEEVLKAIKKEMIIDITKHHNSEKYPNQKILILEVKKYVYYVPFVEDDDEIFLKTIIPSRKLTKKYL